MSSLVISCCIELYKLDPVLLAGCRPLQFVPCLQRAGFEVEANAAVVQLAVPREVAGVTLK